jgi:AbrB family looped-hinge helix DNA binding protein
MKSAISSKGQITVPARIRERLGLTPGTIVTFEITRRGALIRKGGRDIHPVDRIRGLLKLQKAVDALIDETRGPRPRK